MNFIGFFVRDIANDTAGLNVLRRGKVNNVNDTVP